MCELPDINICEPAGKCVQRLNNKDAYCNQGWTCSYGRGPGDYNCAGNGEQHLGSHMYILRNTLCHAQLQLFHCDMACSTCITCSKTIKVCHEIWSNASCLLQLTAFLAWCVTTLPDKTLQCVWSQSVLEALVGSDLMALTPLVRFLAECCSHVHTDA